MDLDELIRRFRGPLVGLIASWGNGPRDARELAQDTFAEAYLARDRFRGSWDADSDVGPWLVGIANNLHHAHGRRRRGPARLRRLDSLEELPAEALAEPAEDEPSDAVDELRRALVGLRGPSRTVLTMRYVDGAGLAEIGALLGLGVRAVEGRLRRARQELQALLEQREQAASRVSAGPNRPAAEPRS